MEGSVAEQPAPPDVATQARHGHFVGCEFVVNGKVFQRTVNCNESLFFVVADGVGVEYFWLMIDSRVRAAASPARLGWVPGSDGHVAQVTILSLEGSAGGGRQGASREQLVAILREWGVPVGVVEARASAALTALGGVSGLATVFEARGTDRRWRLLKRKADQNGFR